MSKYKITFLILNGLPYGGSEKHVVDICNEIDKNRFETQLIYSSGNPLIERLNDKKRAVAIGRTVIDFFKILYIIKKEKPDVLHAHAARALIYGRLIKFILSIFFSQDLKLISTSHGLWVPKNKSRFGLHKLIHFFKGLDDVTLSVSKFSKFELINLGYKKDKVKCIYNGIDFNVFNSSREIKSKIQNVVFVGRLTEQKGISDLMHLILNESKNESNINFKIYGSGHLDKYINKFIFDNNIKNAQLKGHVNNIQDVFKASDLLVAPSIDEGLPYTLVEAINCGLPVISTFVGGVPEVVETGVNGFLVQPGNREALCKAFIKIKNENIQLMSHESIRISQKFSLYTMVRNIESEYQECMK